MRVSLVVALFLALSPLAVGSSSAQTVKSQRASKAPVFAREVEREKANENRITLVSGGLGGPYLHLANDIAFAVNDGDNLRVLPTISNGAVANVRDVLLLKGVDLGITTVQILNALKAKGDFGPNLDSQITYIATLSVDTMHVLAGPGNNSLKDLSGKRVAFNLKGSGTARFAPGILRSLGADIGEADREMHMVQGDAIEAIRGGKLAATLCSCPIPVPAHTGVKSDWGFRFLPIPYVAALERDYVPASLTHDHYPNVIPKGEKVETIATSTILITFNWAPGTERYQKIEKFVDAFFSNFHKLMQPPRHSAWRSVNMSATIRGWRRFPPAQQWLDRQAAKTAAAAGAPTQGAGALPRDPAERERLFKEFLEWARKQPRQ